MRFFQLCGIAIMGFGAILLLCVMCSCAAPVQPSTLGSVKELRMRTAKGVLEVQAPMNKYGDPILCSCHVQQIKMGAQLFCNCDWLY